MRLKQIEIKGFKSFGDKVQIHFTDGVTGIVGPNGCGKSNIVDAIRWVLGEQKTRMLRSDKMENVIFNGTKNRKASHLAEVSLTFDNTKNVLSTDFSEVTITRKLYRSGESEYLLNQVPCRLKDITNLFLDTGIGPDSYAIMELKMIDEILNDREGSRRTLFEEASGISKYKIRKKETLHKLEDTQADLDRVEDILFEIDKNMKSLQSQAKKTEKYYQLREEYKTVSLDLSHVVLRKLEQQLIEIREKEVKLSDQRGALDTQHSEMEAGLQKQKLELVNREKTLQLRQKSTLDILHQIRNYESEKKVLQEQLKSLNEKQINLQKQVFDDKNHVVALSAQTEHLSRVSEEEEKSLSGISTQVAELQRESLEKKAALDSIQQVLQEKQKLLRETDNRLHQLEKELAVNRIQANSMEEEINRQTQETGARQNELNLFDTEIERQEAEANRMENDLGMMRFEETALEQQADQLNQKIEETRQELAERSRTYDAKMNELNLLRSMVESLEGHAESIRFLKKQSNWARNPQFVSDIISCHNEYKVCLENFLEPVMNHMVVQTFTEARAGVFLLKSNSKGRANFIVSSEVQSKKVLTTENKEFISAISVVETDKPFQPLIQQLLGQVFIYKGPEDNFHPEKMDLLKEHPTAIILQKDGFYAGGSFTLSGGSVGMFEGKRLGRKRNVDMLEKETDALASALGLLKANLENLQQVLAQTKSASKKQEIEQLHRTWQSVHQQIAVLKSKKEQFLQLIHSSQDRLETLENKRQECIRFILENEPEMEAKTLDRTTLQTETEALQNDFQSAYEAHQKYSQEYNQINLRFHQQQNMHANTERDLTYKLNQIEQLKARIETNQQQLAVIELEQKSVVQNPELSDDNLLNLYEEKEALEKGVQEAEHHYQACKLEIDRLENDMRTNRKEKELSDSAVFQLKDEENQLKLSKSSLLERLSVEFNLELKEIEQYETETQLEEAGLRKRQNEIKSKLDNFGPINPMAVEAYQEISERHQFISSQRDDLIKAKTSLLETIKEIDETARERFLACFTTVRENFIRVFRSLFTEEDSCDLRLVEPDNPLESAITIMARPKGKKPLTINQLSGGEKTLTAIALLFGLYLYKPAPFCIFDEVDAPLDDQNIDKFNRIIHTFSAESQFILVTHNKRTMETTDVIYGVTMIEQGVSRVVPVDLRSLVN